MLYTPRAIVVDPSLTGQIRYSLGSPTGQIIIDNGPGGGEVAGSNLVEVDHVTGVVKLRQTLDRELIARFLFHVVAELLPYDSDRSRDDRKRKRKWRRTRTAAMRVSVTVRDLDLFDLSGVMTLIWSSKIIFFKYPTMTYSKESSRGQKVKGQTSS